MRSASFAVGVLSKNWMSAAVSFSQPILPVSFGNTLTEMHLVDPFFKKISISVIALSSHFMPEVANVEIDRFTFPKFSSSSLRANVSLIKLR